jgi:hypothetical protein
MAERLVPNVLAPGRLLLWWRIMANPVAAATTATIGPATPEETASAELVTAILPTVTSVGTTGTVTEVAGAEAFLAASTGFSFTDTSVISSSPYHRTEQQQTRHCRDSDNPSEECPTNQECDSEDHSSEDHCSEYGAHGAGLSDLGAGFVSCHC